MILHRVYLAGPITGLSYNGSTDWREYVTKNLESPIVKVLSPLRKKQYLSNEKSIADSYEDLPLSSQKGITTRDRNDAFRCDVLFVNLLNAQKVSIGSVMEIAWADSKRTPIVLVMDDDNVHNHAMIREVSGYIVKDLDSGILIVKAILDL